MGCGAAKAKAPTQPKAEAEKQTPPRPEITLIAKADVESLLVFDQKFVVPDGKPCVLHFKRKVLDPNGDEDDHRIEDLNGSGLCFQVGEISNDAAPKKVSDGAGVPVYNVVTLGPYAMIQEYDTNGQPVVGEKTRVKVGAKARQENDGHIMTEKAWCTDLINKRGDAIELYSNFECRGTACYSLDGGLWLGTADPSQPAIAKVSNAKGLVAQFPDAGLMATSNVLEIPPGADAALMVAYVLAALECHRSFTKSRGAAVPLP